MTTLSRKACTSPLSMLVACLLLGSAAVACGGDDQTSCLADDDGNGTLAATAVFVGDTKSSDTGLHDTSCRNVAVSVYADAPVDGSLQTGALLPPTNEPLASASTAGEKPATFELPPSVYIVCFGLEGQLPLCTRVTVADRRVIATMLYHGSPTFQIQ